MAERRKYRRALVPPGSLLSFVPITAAEDSSELLEGDGIVLDISQGGCRVRSDQRIALELPYSLILQLPTYPNPVAIESAIARWIDREAFGLMFIAMQQQQERFLQEFLGSLREEAA
jgi:hypothetical protein